MNEGCTSANKLNVELDGWREYLCKLFGFAANVGVKPKDERRRGWRGSAKKKWSKEVESITNDKLHGKLDNFNRVTDWWRPIESARPVGIVNLCGNWPKTCTSCAFVSDFLVIFRRQFNQNPDMTQNLSTAFEKKWHLSCRKCDRVNKLSIVNWKFVQFLGYFRECHVNWVPFTRHKRNVAEKKMLCATLKLHTSCAVRYKFWPSKPHEFGLYRHTNKNLFDQIIIFVVWLDTHRLQRKTLKYLEQFWIAFYQFVTKISV